MIIADFHEKVTQNYLLNIDPTLNQSLPKENEKLYKIPAKLRQAQLNLSNHIFTHQILNKSQHPLLPTCFDTPGVSSSRNFYVNISCTSELVQHIKSKCTPISIETHQLIQYYNVKKYLKQFFELHLYCDNGFTDVHFSKVWLSQNNFLQIS